MLLTIQGFAATVRARPRVRNITLHGLQLRGGGGMIGGRRSGAEAQREQGQREESRALFHCLHSMCANSYNSLPEKMNKWYSSASTCYCISATVPGKVYDT
jgi:hypothetical protein